MSFHAGDRAISIRPFRFQSQRGLPFESFLFLLSHRQAQYRHRIFTVSILLLFGFAIGCAAPLANPTGPNSSLVVGRVIINNQYPGPSGAGGTLHIGKIEELIDVEIVNHDESEVLEATTVEGGFFFSANIPPGVYYLHKVIMRGEADLVRETVNMNLSRRHFFTVPTGSGKIVPAGTYHLDVAKRFGIKLNHEEFAPGTVKMFLMNKYPNSLWLKKLDGRQGKGDVLEKRSTAGIALTNPTDELTNATRQGKLMKVKTLIAAGADLNAKDKIDETALMAATNYGHVNIAKALIAAGADVNAKDDKGVTALMYASINGRVDAADALIAAGADVNAKDDKGVTALMAASRTTRGHVNIVKALIMAGADVNAKDGIGDTAQVYASAKGHFDIVHLIKEANSKLAKDDATKPEVTKKGPHLSSTSRQTEIDKQIEKEDRQFSSYFKIPKSGSVKKIEKKENEIASLGKLGLRVREYFSYLKGKISEEWESQLYSHSPRKIAVAIEPELLKYPMWVKLKFVIRADGTLRRVEILSSSGHQALDEVALRAITEAAPFKPFPPALKSRREFLPITGLFDYHPR